MLYVVTKCCTTITFTILSINVCTNWRAVRLSHLHFTVSELPFVTIATPASFLSFPFLSHHPVVLVNRHLFMLSEHSTQNTVHSFILYNMFRLFVFAIFRKNDNNVNWKVCRGVWRGFVNLVAKHTEEKQFGWPRRRWKDDVKMGHTEMRWTCCSLMYRRVGRSDGL